jgi:hypothetical protein
VDVSRFNATTTRVGVGKIGTLPEDANIIPLASAKAKARTADTKDE